MPPKQESRREVLERLHAVWEANPHLRLGQLLHQAIDGAPIDYLFDDELIQLIEEYLPRRKTRRVVSPRA